MLCFWHGRECVKDCGGSDGECPYDPYGALDRLDNDVQVRHDEIADEEDTYIRNAALALGQE